MRNRLRRWAIGDRYRVFPEPRPAVWTSEKGAWQFDDLTVTGSHHLRDGVAVLDTVVVRKGDLTSTWNPPSRGFHGGWGWVLHDANACEKDGVVRVDLLVGVDFAQYRSPYRNGRRWPGSWPVLELFHLRFLFGSKRVECHSLVRVGHFGCPWCVVRYLEDGRYQLVIEHGAAWGVPGLFPLPMLPIELVHLEKTTCLTELRSPFETR